MIKEIKKVQDKYQQMMKTSEYVSIGQVVNDLYQLIQEARIKRIPKNKQ